MFKLFSRQQMRDAPVARFSGVTDDAWTDVLVRRLNEPVIDEIRVPGSQDDTLRKNIVGYAGAPTLHYTPFVRFADCIGDRNVSPQAIIVMQKA